MILDDIIARTRKDLATRMANQDRDELEMAAAFAEPTRDFEAALRKESRFNVIAEVKKASPSKGVIRTDFDPVAIAKEYEAAGAAAISVLTEPRYFQGAPEHLSEIRFETALPLLRKDFIVDEFQVLEARALGADAILFIMSALTDDEAARLIGFATGLSMQPLVEIHTEDELWRALGVGARIVGINNRDLATFKTDLAVTEKLAPLVPKGLTIVSESGIATAEDIKRVRAAGAHAMLVGEAFMRADSPGQALKAFMKTDG